jgi:beta-galactosidase
MVDIPWPGLLRELCGAGVDEFEAFPDHIQNTAVYRGKTYPVRWWADVLRLEDARPEAVYGERFYRGSPAVTVREYGKGRAVYFGAAGARELIRDYLAGLFKDYGIKTLDVPDRVFISTRKSPGTSYTFIINMGSEEKEFDPGAGGTDLLSGKKVSGPLRIGPLEALIIEGKGDAG